MATRYDKKVVIFAIIIVALAFFFMNVSITGAYTMIKKDFRVSCAEGTVGTNGKFHGRGYWVCKNGFRDERQCPTGRAHQRIKRTLRADGRWDTFRTIECRDISRQQPLGYRK